ncbi:MAG: 2-phosphosulfolactate phosphatase [Clostridia bacterium]|nr:2-phosphosulfolactate phosphatase [Clostridia bacterium]
MNINVFSTALDIVGDRLDGKTAIVIDVLRATSTIIQALDNGCKGVIPVKRIQDAFERAERLGRECCILGGERGCNKIDGFDLSNSPLEYTHDSVAGKIVIITTTNGTNAVIGARDAEITLIGAMINSEAVARRCVRENRDIAIICAGTHGRFSLDDISAAGAIIDDILKYTNGRAILDDLAINCSYIYRHNKNNIHQFLKTTQHYKRLSSLGYSHDIDFCFRKDTTDTVPFVKNGMIIS